LHVVDTPMTRVYGDETADRETGADRRYLDDVARALHDLGFDARPVLLYGPDRAGRLVSHIKKNPVDLLVVGSHGHGLVRDLLLGQTVDKVRHGLDVPMLIARPDRAGSSSWERSSHPSDDGDQVTTSAMAPAEPV
jgi:manganese transport protein